jgi:hypothetical protein
MYMFGGDCTTGLQAPFAQRVRRDISGADNTPRLIVSLAGSKVAEEAFIFAGVLLVVGRQKRLTVSSRQPGYAQGFLAL